MLIVDITDEYDHIKEWAQNNRIIINELNTKELVFHKPCPQRFHVGSAIDATERVSRIIRCYCTRKF